MKKNIVFAFLLFCAGGFGREELFCQGDQFKRAHVGFCVVEIKSGQEVCSLHSEEYFVPASLQKIPLSVAALALLGENYRFSTVLEYEGTIDQEGVLHGDLHLRGGGDPTLSLDALEEWVEAVKKKGILQVDGKLLVDPSCFETALASPAWFFEDLGNYFGAGACGLSFNQNMYEITFQPGLHEGDPAQVIKTDPSFVDLTIHNEVKTGPAGSGDQVYVFGMEYSNVQFYRGTVPIDKPSTVVKAAIPDPPRFCGEALCRNIEGVKGVQVVANRVKDTDQRGLLHRKESLPLKDLVQQMNLHSVNLYAEHLLKTIGQGTLKKGAKRLEAFLHPMGVAAMVVDGSGLARTNFITPRGFATLLCEIRKNPSYQSIYDSFPEPGKKGTLHSFPLLQGADMRAKSGSMKYIRNLGGYLTLPSGKEFAFCLFCNNYEGSHKEIEKEMYRFLNCVVQQINCGK